MTPTRTYMHHGPITDKDITEETAYLKTSDHYPETGWKHCDEPATLTQLANQWAYSENELDPDDRATFTAWISMSLDEGIIEEPPTRVYDAQRIITSVQNITFEAPAELTQREAGEWFLDHEDDALISAGSETVTDEDMYFGD